MANTMTEAMAAPWTDPSLSSSITLSSSTFSQSSRQQSSQIVRIYREASELFLTRRLPEALQVLEPVIKPEVADGQQDGSNGYGVARYAPVAHASRNTRIKVWSLYLTLLNAVIELGPDEGKHTFGSSQWKALVASVKEGRIWEDVVQHGYGGAEGEVDAEIIVSLATLLLTYSTTQLLTQSRLETYLSISSHPSSSTLATHLAQVHESQNSQKQARHVNNGAHVKGTSTPKDLNTRLKILELFTLHVLPRNEEWDYARAFIHNSEVLDDERREAFLLALQELRDGKDRDSVREEELRKEQEEQAEQVRIEREEEALRVSREAEEEEKARRRKEEDGKTHKKKGLETDQGTDTKPSKDKPLAKSSQVKGQSDGHSKGPPSPPPRSVRPAKTNARTSPGIYKRASSMLVAMQHTIMQATRSMSGNPMAMLRMLLFVIALIMALGRRDIRERLRRMLGTGWDKVRSTIGMGVKVSYI